MSVARVRERIREACRAAGRADDAVRLVVVTKGHGPDEIDRAVLAHGVRALGENRVQEWRGKAEALPTTVEWHFVGSLQRNKAKYLARSRVPWLHSLDSARLADALEAQAARYEHRFQVLVEVNVSGEASKQGVAPEALPALLRHVAALDRVDVRGLMTMAPHTSEVARQRDAFRRLRELRDAHGLPELSMGMSGDLEAAIAEGATMVRVGTAAFEDAA